MSGLLRGIPIGQMETGQRWRILPCSHQQLHDLGSPKVSSLGRNVVLLTWDVSHAKRISAPALKSDGDDIWPLASLRLSLPGGGTRLFWVFQRPAEGRIAVELSVESIGIRTSVAIDADTVIALVNPEDLIGGIDRHDCVALISALFNVWGTMFHLQRNSAFIEILSGLLSQIAPTPGPTIAVARVADDAILARTSMISGFGKIDAIYAFGKSGPVRILAQPYTLPDATAGREVIHFLIDRALASSDDDFLLVLIGPGGLSVRRMVRPISASRPLKAGFAITRRLHLLCASTSLRKSPPDPQQGPLMRWNCNCDHRCVPGAFRAVSQRRLLRSFLHWQLLPGHS